MAVTRKEILISEASLGYLQSDEMSEAFCGQCPWSESRQGRELFTGLPTPSDQECPADFDLRSDHCAMKGQFAEVVETLADADKLAGMKRNVKIIL